MVRAEVTRRGKKRPCLRILGKVFTALSDPAGVIAHRPGALERAEWVLSDWDTARTQQVDIQDRMVAVLDELDLTTLVTTIPALSAVGAAAILAQTGDLSRFTSARAVVKHAGLAPRERMSGTFTGRARLTGAGRPALRTAAWRAVWGCLQTNNVYPARYRHLTTRETNRLKPTQAQTVIAARSCASCTPSSSTSRHGTRSSLPAAPRAKARSWPPELGDHRAGVARHQQGRGEPSAALRTPTGISSLIKGRPGPSSQNPITRCRATKLHYRYAGTTTGHGHPTP